MALGPHSGHPSQLFNSDHQVMPPSGGPGQYHDYMGGHGGSDPSVAGSMSDSEFEEIVSKNKSVAGSAISRAVSDAAAGKHFNYYMGCSDKAHEIHCQSKNNFHIVGDCSTAIDTLLTAISLIKRSKVSGDERCRILVSSLQDTLHAIEAKNYGSRGIYFKSFSIYSVYMALHNLHPLKVNLHSLLI